MSAYRALRQYVLNAASDAMGSFPAFAARLTSGWSGINSHSLHGA
jgi:hypothetical protein